jgi:hypothetical protein
VWWRRCTGLLVLNSLYAVVVEFDTCIDVYYTVVDVYRRKEPFVDARMGLCRKWT